MENSEDKRADLSETDRLYNTPSVQRCDVENVRKQGLHPYICGLLNGKVMNICSLMQIKSAFFLQRGADLTDNGVTKYIVRSYTWLKIPQSESGEPILPHRYWGTLESKLSSSERWTCRGRQLRKGISTQRFPKQNIEFVALLLWKHVNQFERNTINLGGSIGERRIIATQNSSRMRQ